VPCVQFVLLHLRWILEPISNSKVVHIPVAPPHHPARIGTTARVHPHGGFAMPHANAVSRRDFLKAGAVSAGAVGLSLADLSRLDAGAGKDINCILLFLVGGPSHLDTFDLKPDAPDNVRGPFRPIRTNVPGIDLCEPLPRT